MPILGIMASAMSANLWQPQGAYDALATVTVPSGGAASVTFASIPNTYKHLQIRVLVQTNYLDYRNDAIKVRYNADANTSNYYTHQLYGSGSSAGSQSYAADGVIVSYIASALSNTNMFGTAIIDVLDYTSTTKTKTTRSLAGWDGNGAGFAVLNSTGWFATPAAINTVQILPNAGTLLNQYSQFTLYGVR